MGLDADKLSMVVVVEPFSRMAPPKEQFAKFTAFLSEPPLPGQDLTLEMWALLQPTAERPLPFLDKGRRLPLLRMEGQIAGCSMSVSHWVTSRPHRTSRRMRRFAEDEEADPGARGSPEEPTVTKEVAKRASPKGGPSETELAYPVIH
ncbi:uncharacterized protein LOC119322002 isoform X1 [Triticum dicoccoides]|uniref:uncharacterized protein LOC119322002 isoform X1 n=1 Tax=Triticum dicoccoides TaxID=85692 RepID=UPI0018913ACB|nr:uncharacterized protein LOC119322002 isoform X1 [Triticum dicoccoides]